MRLREARQEREVLLQDLVALAADGHLAVPVRGFRCVPVPFAVVMHELLVDVDQVEVLRAVYCLPAHVLQAVLA